MKHIIALVSVILAGAAFPAFAHSEHNKDIDAWVDSYFQELDTEGNGYISKEEFMDHAEKKFDEMDADHDGKLSKKEVKRYKLKEQADWQRYHGTKRGGRNKPDATMSDKDRPDVNEEDKTNAGDSGN